MGRRPELQLDDEKIKQMYLTNKYTCADLSTIFGCTDVAVRNHLVAQGIKLRPRGKWKFKYPKKPFSGSILEEAYVLGFRIGDLNVFKEWPQSRAITVRSHTTQQVQVNLFESIFSKYSTVVTRKMKDGTFSSTCFLDLSFDFLLQKNAVPKKYEKNKKAAWAFIAGYTDAEGNIILNQGKARFKIDSYDLFVLSWAHRFLIKQGINSKLRRIGVMGEPVKRNSTIRWNADLWRLNVNSAESLKILLKELKPYLRHETRVSHAEIARKNIEQRQEKHAKH